MNKKLHYCWFCGVIQVIEIIRDPMNYKELERNSHDISLKNVQDQTIEYAFTLPSIKFFILPIIQKISDKTDISSKNCPLAFFKKALAYQAVHNTLLNKDFKIKQKDLNAQAGEAILLQSTLYNYLKFENYYTKYRAIHVTIASCIATLGLLYCGASAFDNNFKLINNFRLFASLLLIQPSFYISKSLIINTKERFEHYSLVNLIDNMEYIKNDILKKEYIRLNAKANIFEAI